MVDISNYKKPSHNRSIVYNDTPLSIAPVPKSDELPIPIPLCSAEGNDTGSRKESRGAEWKSDCVCKPGKPKFPNQAELDDFGERFMV